jgi:hypothetical protein
VTSNSANAIVSNGFETPALDHGVYESGREETLHALSMALATMEVQGERYSTAHVGP